MSQDENFLSQPLDYTEAKNVEVEDKERHWQDDLNTTIKSLFIKMHGLY